MKCQEKMGGHFGKKYCGGRPLSNMFWHEEGDLLLRTASRFLIQNLHSSHFYTRVLQKGHFSTKKPRETRHINIWPIRNHFKPKKVPKLQCRGLDLPVQNWYFVWFLLWLFKLVVLKNLPQKVQSFKIPIFCVFKVQTTLV